MKVSVLLPAEIYSNKVKFDIKTKNKTAKIADISSQIQTISQIPQEYQVLFAEKKKITEEIIQVDTSSTLELEVQLRYDILVIRLHHRERRLLFTQNKNAAEIQEFIFNETKIPIEHQAFPFGFNSSKLIELRYAIPLKLDKIAIHPEKVKRKSQTWNKPWAYFSFYNIFNK